jgi:hypothetical protein
MRNEVMAAASEVSYGTWKLPDSPYRIRYALDALREIEFHVSEGFRRIPYGGIEHGGLLFGRHADEAIQIEAFRPIECEHAAGPSFSLSEGDLAGIRSQLATFAEQPELAGFKPVGIFISHSRRDLRVSSDEENLLGRLFPERWQCLLLVKPTKFKPTQFGFVLRGASSVAGANLEEAAFVLPPPVRPDRKSRREPQTLSPEMPDSRTVSDIAPVEAAAETKPKPQRARTRRAAAKPEPAVEGAGQASKPAVEESGEAVSPHAFRAPPQSATSAEQGPLLTPPVAGGLAALLLLPLAVCFLWFYWNYLQPPIDVHATAQPGRIVLTWPAQATSVVARAQLRVSANQDDRVIALSPAERNAGRATVPVTSHDVTIELVAFHWLHDRRGMVRVVTNP